MFGLRYIIIRKNSGKDTKDTLPLKDEKEIMSSRKFYMDGDYIRYINKYGHHFCEKLAEYASNYINNENGKEHFWSSSQVRKVMSNLGLKINEKEIHDATYSANLSYSLFFPIPLKEETDCFEMAYREVNNPNKYEGEIFDEWVYSMMKKGETINWGKYL